MASEVPSRPQVSWPKVLGILMIVLGSLGILCNGSGAYGNYGYRALRAFHEMAAKAGTGKALTADQIEFLNEPLMRHWNIASTVAIVLMALLAVVLLAAGIGMITRHAWAIRTATGWAVAKIAIEVATALGGWIVQHRIVQAVESGMLKAETVPDAYLNVSAGSVAMQVVLGVVLPVFILIWLSLPSTKEETVHWT